MLDKTPICDRAVARGADDEAIALERAVRDALERLPEIDAAIVERYFFFGWAPSRIARYMGMSSRELERRLREATMRLRELLRDFVLTNLNVPQKARHKLRRAPCAICTSPRRAEAELILSRKAPEATWRTTLRELREKLGISLSGPQAIIGHQKYHPNFGPNTSEKEIV